MPFRFSKTNPEGMRCLRGPGLLVRRVLEMEMFASPEKSRKICKLRSDDNYSNLLKFVNLVTNAIVVTLIKFENKVTRKSKVIFVIKVTTATIGTLVTLVTGGHGNISNQIRRNCMQVLMWSVCNFCPVLTNTYYANKCYKNL
jgi:hypothetical protein